MQFSASRTRSPLSTPVSRMRRGMSSLRMNWSSTCGSGVLACPIAAAISFFWTVVFKESYFVALFAFCAFEFGLGVYWPAMAVLRGELVPNSLRASVTSVFRVPLNVLVVMLLTAAGRASERALLLCCAAMMSVCFILNVNEG